MNMGHLRKAYHEEICKKILGYRREIPNIADKTSKASIELAQGILTRLGFSPCLEPTVFDQYEHLNDLADVLRKHPRLRATLGDYLVTPDILVGRSPVSDQDINQDAGILQTGLATLTPLRADNFPDPKPILHASISCKWTIRSDRSQNARTEGLDLIRNRKGSTPHIAIVTAEPLPSRIASVALGTGDLDCVYHMALYELGESVEEVGDETLSETFDLLVDGKRLRDISDLPFDLAI